MVGGMKDLCEWVNIWNSEKHDDNYDFREGGSHLESWELA